MEPAPETLPQCLTIAGSDSGGGAGIQGDLKAFHANGAFGMSVITSITAQNTLRVARAFELPLDLIEAQLQAIFEDFEVSAAKTGMLSSAPVVELVASFWERLPSPPPLVVDPVMVSKGGHPLLSRDAVDTVRRRLIPLAAVVTPNREEAELLSGLEIRDPAGAIRAGRSILDSGARAVLLKGGHLCGDGFDERTAVDYLLEGGRVREFASKRHDTSSTHGTGCTFSAAICAWLARGLALEDAVERAKLYVSEAIRRGLRIGHGHGPTNHFYFLLERESPARPEVGP